MDMGGSIIKPAHRSSLTEEVTNQIIELIRNGTWGPGKRIPGENALAKQFDVSRNCVREAQKSLELIGVLASKPGKGTYVLEESLRNMQKMELILLLKDERSFEDLLDTRLLLETRMAELAAEKATEEEIWSLEEIVNQEQQSTENTELSVAFGFDFHKTIARISKNRILYTLLLSITDELRAQREILLVKKARDPGFIDKNHREHEEIFLHIKSRRPQDAAGAMYQHINNAYRPMV